MALSVDDFIKLMNDRIDQQENRHKNEIKSLFRKMDDMEKKYVNVIGDQKVELGELKASNQELQRRTLIMENDMKVVFNELEETTKLAYSTDQYVRRLNVEISGIPHECDENLEEVVLDLVNELRREVGEYHEDDDADIGKFDIHAVHRLNTKNKDGVKNVIVRFTNRKSCDEIHANKSKTRNLQINDLGDSVKNIYFNENLNKFNKDLSAKCRRLKKRKMIKDTWTVYGSVKIKLNDDSFKIIAHQHDLNRLFPNFVYY